MHNSPSCGENTFNYLGIFLTFISLMCLCTGIFQGAMSSYHFYNIEKENFKKNDGIKVDKNYRENLEILVVHLKNTLAIERSIFTGNVKETATLSYKKYYNIVVIKNEKKILEESFDNINDLGFSLINNTRFRIQDFI